MRTPLRVLAAHQHGAFSTAQAMRCYTESEIRARRASGRWVTVFAGAHRACTAAPGTRLRLAAAALSIGREVPACLHTAAELHGFGLLDDPVTHVEGVEASLRRPTLWPHQLVLADGDLERLRFGSVATTADRTAVDLARTQPRADALALLDAAIAAGACTQDSLLSELTRHAGLRGVLQARELVPLAVTGPDSPQESRLRLLCHDAGLPRPVVQLPVADGSGAVRRWIDLGWPDAMVGLEYDGKESHADRHHSDRRRHNWLQNLGWTMFYATDQDVYGDPAPLLTALAAALLRRSWGAAQLSNL